MFKIIKYSRILFCCFLGFILSPHAAYAAKITLAWDPSPDADVTGYKIYYGTESRNYTFTPINAGNVTQYPIPIPFPYRKNKIYYFAVTAYTDDGTESPFSSEVSSFNAFTGTAVLASRLTTSNACDMDWDSGETVNVNLSFNFLGPFLLPHSFIFKPDDERVTCLPGVFTQHDDNNKIEAVCGKKGPFGIFTLYWLTFEGSGNVSQKNPLSMSAEVHSIFNWKCPLYSIEMNELQPVE